MPASTPQALTECSRLVDAVRRDPRAYDERDWRFIAQPNLLLAPNSVTLSDLTFPTAYDDCKDMIGFDGSTAQPASASVVVKVIDSGVDPSSGLNEMAAHDFSDSQASHMTDDLGHGTVVTSIIRDLAPDADIHVYKVVDQSLRANEFNVLAALAADVGPLHVVNMSLAYGFQDRACIVCGRSAGTSRSRVCEQMLADVGALDPVPIVVAAAGNEGQAELAYPARFGQS